MFWKLGRAWHVLCVWCYFYFNMNDCNILKFGNAIAIGKDDLSVRTFSLSSFVFVDEQGEGHKLDKRGEEVVKNQDNAMHVSCKDLPQLS